MCTSVLVYIYVAYQLINLVITFVSITSYLFYRMCICNTKIMKYYVMEFAGCNDYFIWLARVPRYFVLFGRECDRGQLSSNFDGYCRHLIGTSRGIKGAVVWKMSAVNLFVCLCVCLSVSLLWILLIVSEILLALFIENASLKVKRAAFIDGVATCSCGQYSVIRMLMPSARSEQHPGITPNEILYTRVECVLQ